MKAFECGSGNIYYDSIRPSFVTLAINFATALFILKIGGAIIRYDLRTNANEAEERQRRREDHEAGVHTTDSQTRRWRYVVPPTFSWSRATTERPYYEMQDMDNLVQNAGTESTKSVGDAI